MSAKRYHINPETMRPNICQAKTPESCPYYDKETQTPAPHFDNKVDARAYVEKVMKEEEGETKTLQKPPKKKTQSPEERMKQLTKTVSEKNKELSELRQERDKATPEERKKINGVIRGKSIWLSKQIKELNELKKTHKPEKPAVKTEKSAETPKTPQKTVETETSPSESSKAYKYASDKIVKVPSNIVAVNNYNPHMVSSLENAIKADEPVEMLYVSKSGKMSSRTFIPKEFRQTSQNFLVVGWDVQKDDYRSFILSNIQKVVAY